MFAKFKLSIRCLVAIAIATGLLLLPHGSAALDVVSIEGCFNTISTITTPTPGQTNFASSGTGKFFIANHPAGQIASFNFGVDSAPDPDKIIGGIFQNDIELLSTQGAKIFGKMVGTSTGPDANGIITLKGSILFFGGTGFYLGVTGAATFTAMIYTKDFTDSNGVLHKANTGSFCLTGYLRRLFAPPTPTRTIIE